MCTVRYTPHAVEDLKRLDKKTQALIFGWIEKNLDGRDEKIVRRGKYDTSESGGKQCWRIGDYRLIAEMSDDNAVILVLNAGLAV